MVTSKARAKLSLKMSKDEANEAMWDTLRELKESRAIPNILIGVCIALVVVAVYAFLTQ